MSGAWANGYGAFGLSAGETGAYKVDHTALGDQDTGTTIPFDLSRGNSIFGKTETVQTASLRSLVLVRAY